MTRWEHLIQPIYPTDNEREVLHRHGLNGWELVAVALGSSGGEPKRLYLKRPLPPEGDGDG